jgi:hypothetical protein
MILSEYDAFQRLADGLRMAQDGARMMAANRPDQAAQWNKMAQVYTVSIEAVYKLAEESVAKGTKQ